MSNQLTAPDINEVTTLALFGTEFNMYGTLERPLFLAADIAAMIEYSTDKVGQMLENVDPDEKLTDTIHRGGQGREVWFVTELGLYELLMQSRKPVAKAFKGEVKKILTAVRKGELQYVVRGLTNRRLRIDCAEVIFKNFSGAPGRFNDEGDRNFCVVISDANLLSQLQTEGWKIKMLAPRDGYDEPRYYLPVTVKYGDYPPKIHTVTRNATTLLDEKSVGTLDRLRFERVDLAISPSKWEINGNTGI